MSTERVTDEEGCPPAKRLKTEEEEKDGREEEKEMQQTEEHGDQTDKDSDDKHALLGRMREEDVGITEYISQHKGVSAVIKQRYSDFIVNEISTTGEVIHLTNTSIPVVEEEPQPSCPVDEVVPEEFVAQLRQIASGQDPNFTASTPAGDDKEKRFKLHRAIKSSFPNLETKTEEKNGVKVITAMLKGKGKDNRKTKDFDWPSSKKSSPYCRFVLYKENKGTMDVVHLISRFLKVKDNVFSYAGTKDRRAKTSQEITAFKVHPKRLQDLNKFLRNITLGNFRYAEKNLSLGELAGNRFTVVLRNVVGEDEDLEAGLQSLKTVGFINYYGLQRFGTQHCSTHHVGRALLKANWEEAVNLIIAGSSSEGLAYRKEWLDTKNPKKTLDLLENRHYIERQVLRSLLKRPTDFYGAVFSLARNTRLLYPHSYQSMIWNAMTSRRIKTFGLKPIVGDLVLPPGVAVDTDISDEQVSAEEQDKTSEKMTKVDPIVLDETTVSQHTIYDVVLPLPGIKIKYPNNEVFSWYKECLAQDGLDIKNMPQKHKDFTLPGGYRPIVVRPADVEWKTVLYDDVTASLSLSDIDRMEGVEEPESIADGKLKAVVLSFTLGVSSYATMALREVLKIDTSPAQQASMNVT